MQTNDLYRMLPQVGEVAAHGALTKYPRDLAVEAVREVLTRMRGEIEAGLHSKESLALKIDELHATVQRELDETLRPSLRRVINATGVLLQTNLGRAPLSQAAIERIAEVARGYCNVEMDTDTGKRSRRDVHAEPLILRLIAMKAGWGKDFEKEYAAAVVNNCAAATFLALNTLAEGGDVIVSRGELVEIGGGFRVPDILRKSGAVLREVGTTNRTRISDYASAIAPETKLILRVHRSNFRIEGFTEQPAMAELIALGEERGIPVFEDQGTGCIVVLNDYGVADESSWIASVTSGAALVSCSGDKLLGGPQCGLLVGKREHVERIRSNPLFRALRVDKLTYAALEATLLAYFAGDERSIPAVAMMQATAGDIRSRCERWADVLRSNELLAEVEETRAMIGGGTTPGASLPSYAVGLTHARMSEAELASLLRGLDPPVIGRIQEGKVLLDLRTVHEREDDTIPSQLRRVLEQNSASEKSVLR